MKMKKTIGTMLLTVALCMAMSVSAFATDEKVIMPLNPEDIVEYSEVLAEMPPLSWGPLTWLNLITPRTSRHEQAASYLA